MTDVRPVTSEDLALVSELYKRSGTRRGHTRWGYMDTDRARYLCGLDHPDRTTSWIVDERSFLSASRKVLASPDIELVGPYTLETETADELLDLAEAWCAERRLRPTTWICSSDQDRVDFFSRRGYRREHFLKWIWLPRPTLARPYATFASSIEMTDARSDPELYHELYNEAFERHLGDAHLSESDFDYRLADPCCERNHFILARVDGEPAGMIELWADFEPGADERICWLTNIAIREPFRTNLEVHLALLAEGASRMSAMGATGGRGLFDEGRSQLFVLYSLLGSVLGDSFEFWTRA